MKRWARWMQVAAGLAVGLVAVSAAVQAVREGSWGPVETVAWLPAIVVAAWPGTYGAAGRCRPRRGAAGG
jgi:hypothetical protein